MQNHVARRLSPIQRARLSAIGPGQGLCDLPEGLRIRGGYSGAYGRLTEHSVAPTETRWCFHPGSGRWGHPRDARLLTLRELARVCGFRDTPVLAGSHNDGADVLGNAVPPRLAEAVIRAIALAP